MNAGVGDFDGLASGERLGVGHGTRSSGSGSCHGLLAT
jgi:hypothetical protein